MDDYQRAAKRIVSSVGGERARAVVDLLEQGVPSEIKTIDGGHDEAELARVRRLLQAAADSTDEISSLRLDDGWEIGRQRLARALRGELDSL
jgi:hypothetical protein